MYAIVVLVMMYEFVWFSDGICGRYLQIMVRTRGLGLALVRIIGRALGREDCHDSSDAPQQRRPTASARRQRGVVLVAEDEPVLPADEPVVPVTDPVVAANEPMVDADVQDTGANTGVEAAADEPEGFLGGLRDASVLTEYADHVAASVWSGEVFIIFKLSYLLSKCYYQNFCSFNILC